MLKRLILYLFLIHCFNSVCQNTDSLKAILFKAKHDTTKLRILNILIESEQCDTVWPRYNEEMKSVSEKGLKTFDRSDPSYLLCLKYYGGALSNLGVLHQTKGNTKTALDYFFKSIKVFKEARDTNLIGYFYYNIGVVFQSQEDYDKAVEYYKKSLAIYEELEEKTGIAYNLNSLGIVHVLQNRIEKALEYYFKCLDILEDKNDVLFGDCLNNIGNAYKNIGDFPKASEYLYKALEVRERLNNKIGLATTLNNLGSVHLRKKEYVKAEEFSLRSLQLAREFNYLKEIGNAASVLSNVYGETGRYQKALEMQSLFIQMRDSVRNKDIQNSLLTKQFQFETEKKEIENSMLTQKNQIQSLELKQNKNIIIGLVCLVILVILIGVLLIRQYRSQNEKKAMQLEQRVLRAQMNPHFLFNSLNSIQRLFIEGKTEQANDVIADFSNLLRRILNNSGSSLVSLKEETDTLKLYMDIEKIRCDGCFTYSIEIAESIDLLNTLVPPLLIQPFVENAIWHGILPAKKKGLIKIRILKSQNLKNLICTIHDNGVGINLNNLNNSNSKGIQITKQRIGKEVIFETPEEGGTIVTLNIPINI